MSMSREFGKPSGVAAGSLHVHSFLPAVVQSSYFWSDHVENSSISLLTLMSDKSVLYVLVHRRWKGDF